MLNESSLITPQNLGMPAATASNNPAAAGGMPNGENGMLSKIQQPQAVG
jgi:hypothetical protein